MKAKSLLAAVLILTSAGTAHAQAPVTLTARDDMGKNSFITGDR